ncbi:MAG: carboxypeptidase-like regulatory domain-containing protein, partial [Planctomycetota bacterium]|nr:carboxypeptidase-like regulatory domain-containing protein [Planctomycetota bacterium]
RSTFVARTNGEGEFFVFGLWFDKYELGITHPKFLHYTSDASPTDSRVEHELTMFGRVAGIVVDSKKKPVAGATVYVDEATAQSGADGTFLVERCEPDEQTASLKPLRAGNQVTVHVEQGKTVEGVELIDAPPATLRVVAVDKDGKTVPGARAHVAGYESERDDAGVLRVLVPARLDSPSLQIEAPGYFRQYRNFGPSLPRDLGEVVMRAIERVDLLVRGPDGRPVAEGRLASRYREEKPILEAGRAKVLVGSWTLTVPGFPERYLDLEPPGPHTIDLPQPFTLRGRLVSFRGEPLADVAIGSRRTDADGRFVLGPSWRSAFEVSIRGPWRRRTVFQAVASDEEVVLRLAAPEPDAVFGRVLRDGRPVTEFAVEAEWFVDPNGAFEVAVDRARQKIVRVQVEYAEYRFALPPPGEELVARIPTAQVTVTASPDASVAISREDGPSRWSFSGARRWAGADASGVARFRHVAPGSYRVECAGHRTEFITVGESATVTVRVEPVQADQARIRPAWSGSWRQGTPGEYPCRIEFSDTPYDWVELSIPRPIEEIDLDPAAGGVLVARANEDLVVVVMNRRDYSARIGVMPDDAGVARFPLRPGEYVVRTRRRRASVVVRAGEETGIDLRVVAGAKVTGIVRLADNAPAAAVTVTLRGDDIWHLESGTDAKGSFRFEGVPAGEFSCEAALEGYATAQVAVTVANGAASIDGALVLRRATGGVLRVLGPSGRPFAGVDVHFHPGVARTDMLGEVPLPPGPAVVSIVAAALVRIDRRLVTAGETIRLAFAGRLEVVSDAPADRIVVRARGRTWPRDDYQPYRGRLLYSHLPPGPVEIELLPDENENENENENEGEGEGE